MRTVQIRLTVDIGWDRAEFDLEPLMQRMADNPIDLAAAHLDRAYADARKWLDARRREEGSEADGT